jgi:hypothetical protein
MYKILVVNCGPIPALICLDWSKEWRHHDILSQGWHFNYEPPENKDFVYPHNEIIITKKKLYFVKQIVQI